MECEGHWAYVLEAAVKDLELLPGEAGLSLQLLQAFRPVAHRRLLQLILHAVCREERERESQSVCV